MANSDGSCSIATEQRLLSQEAEIDCGRVIAAAMKRSRRAADASSACTAASTCIKAPLRISSANADGTANGDGGCNIVTAAAVLLSQEAESEADECESTASTERFTEESMHRPNSVCAGGMANSDGG